MLTFMSIATDDRLTVIDLIIAANDAMGLSPAADIRPMCEAFERPYKAPRRWRDGDCNFSTRRWAVENGYLKPYTEGTRKTPVGTMPNWAKRR